ncbi:Arsj [Symbiodinium sp. CCMP2592]|nr:Arsj [Symbiodinium sp. CCMP2592]
MGGVCVGLCTGLREVSSRPQTVEAVSTGSSTLQTGTQLCALCDLTGVSYVDDVSARANEQLRLQGRPLLAEVEGRPQFRPDALHLSPTTLLKWPYKLLTGQQQNSVWLGPLFPNCSGSLRQRLPLQRRSRPRRALGSFCT